MFLDAHCEVGFNWLPPLLAPIHENPKTLTAPVIDGIQWSDFSINPVYAEGRHSRGWIIHSKCLEFLIIVKVQQQHL